MLRNWHATDRWRAGNLQRSAVVRCNTDRWRACQDIDSSSVYSVFGVNLMPPIGGKFFRHVKPALRCAQSCCSAVYRSHDRPWRTLHQRCVGCETQSRPGRYGTAIEQQQRWGNRRRRSRRRGAATANEWRSPRTEPKAVARSALPKARAEVSALVRARLHGAVHGEAPATHGVRRRRAEAKPAAGAAGQGERSEFRDERGAQRRGEEDTAVTLAVPSNVATTVSARHTAGSAASRRASGARSERQRTEARGIPARRVETAQRARQGSPVAKRRAQP